MRGIVLLAVGTSEVVREVEPRSWREALRGDRMSGLRWSVEDPEWSSRVKTDADRTRTSYRTT